MPEVIDNVKVGEFIKGLLKENNMTQETLANKLSITKSAVSQNLNGKSSFDMQNLLTIAKMFSLKLDDLLSCRKPDNDNYASEYQKFAAKGLLEISKYNPHDLQIQEPDIYGRVLVDYLIDEGFEDIFLYLHDSAVDFVRDYYHRSRDIYLKIILYLLKKNIPGAIRYIKRYAKLNNTFDISLTTYGKEIWALLNTDINRSLVKEMMELQIDQEYKFLIFNKVKTVRAISKDLWIKTIGMFKLEKILDTFLEFYAKPNEIYIFTKLMLNHEYYKGIEAFINKFFSEEVPLINRSAYHFQKAINLIIETDNFNLFKKFVNNKIFENLTEVVINSIKQEKKNYYEFCLNSTEVNPELDYEKVGLLALERNDLKIMDKIKAFLSQKQLNFLISQVKNNDVALLKYLIDAGARWDFTYYNSQMMDNINLIIDHLKIKEGNN